METEAILSRARTFAEVVLEQVRSDPLGTAVMAGVIVGVLWGLAQVLRWLRRPLAGPHPAAAGASLPGGGALRRQAKRLARGGEGREAGHLFDALGDLDRAAEQYERARAYPEAAAVHERARRFNRAASLYERAGDLARAAECMQQAGDHRRAAALFLKGGRELRAGEALEQGRHFAEAAALYERAGSLEKAAALYERAGASEVAAKVLERLLLTRHGGGRGEYTAPPTLPADGRALLEKCAALYRIARQPGRAAAVLLHWGATAEAAKLFLEAGEPRRALELYRASGHAREAMEICQRIGADAEYHALQAEQFARTGMAREAAEAWVRAGEPDRAAEYYRELGEWERAGDLLRLAGRLEAAAEMYEAGDQWAKAGAAYAEARRFQDAGRSYRQAGMAREAAAALAEEGDVYGAGVLLADADAADEAIAMLQKLPPGAPDYAAGSLLLARLLLARGMAQPALVRLQAIARHPGVAGRTAEVHYLLGRAYEETNRPEEALGQYERVLAEQVDYEDAGIRIAALRGQGARVAAAEGSTVALGGPHGAPARYRVTRELGRGGMGIVYEAHDQTLMRPVALKVPAPAIQSSAPARERFLREARIAAGLRHPNIITVYDAGEAVGGLYIAMELIEGVSLDAYLESRWPLPPEDLLVLGRQICAGLAHAHANGIVHADVKPANMIVDAEGTVHLTDFGLARAWESAKAGTAEARGTPTYIAPEQIRGEPLDARADIYGLGCTLYRMVAGTPPFTTGELLFRHLHEAPPRLRPENPTVSEALEGVILRCLAKRPEDRFSSVDQVLRALEAAVAAGAPSPVAARPVRPAAPA